MSLFKYIVVNLKLKSLFKSRRISICTKSLQKTPITINRMYTTIFVEMYSQHLKTEALALFYSRAEKINLY